MSGIYDSLKLCPERVNPEIGEKSGSTAVVDTMRNTWICTVRAQYWMTSGVREMSMINH